MNYKQTIEDQRADWWEEGYEKARDNMMTETKRYKSVINFNTFPSNKYLDGMVECENGNWINIKDIGFIIPQHLTEEFKQFAGLALHEKRKHFEMTDKEKELFKYLEEVIK